MNWVETKLYPNLASSGQVRQCQLCFLDRGKNTVLKWRRRSQFAFKNNTAVVVCRYLQRVLYACVYGRSSSCGGRSTQRDGYYRRLWIIDWIKNEGLYHIGGMTNRVFQDDFSRNLCWLGLISCLRNNWYSYSEQNPNKKSLEQRMICIYLHTHTHTYVPMCLLWFNLRQHAGRQHTCMHACMVLCFDPVFVDELLLHDTWHAPIQLLRGKRL